MSVVFRIPGSLRKWFDGQDEARCHGATMGECIRHLEGQYPGIEGRLLDSDGGVANVLIFLNGDNIMKMSGLETPVKDGDEVGVIPLAAGG